MPSPRVRARFFSCAIRLVPALSLTALAVLGAVVVGCTELRNTHLNCPGSAANRDTVTICAGDVTLPVSFEVSSNGTAVTVLSEEGAQRGTFVQTTQRAGNCIEVIADTAGVVSIVVPKDDRNDYDRCSYSVTPRQTYIQCQDSLLASSPGAVDTILLWTTTVNFSTAFFSFTPHGFGIHVYENTYGNEIAYAADGQTAIVSRTSAQLTATSIHFGQTNGAQGIGPLDIQIELRNASNVALDRATCTVNYHW